MAGAILLGSVAHARDESRATFRGGAKLPGGDGADLVRWRCTFCHSMDPPSLPRQDLSGWTETVDRMIRWGVPLPPVEREIVIRYLVIHFGPESRP
jgi:hypothetical protein